MAAVQKITPMLWFAGRAEEAAELYTSLFPDSRILRVVPYPDNAPGGGVPGQAMVVDFELAGQFFSGLNGPPIFTPTEASSLVIHCDDQAEVDHYWHGLIAGGGAESQCGWLKDRFGFSWQVTPKRLYELIGDPSPARSQAAFNAMLTMRKIDIATIEAAADAAG